MAAGFPLARFGLQFGVPSSCSARFGKNGDFLAAQPPKRSFDRPARWYLRYLRARDVQSATLPLVYVTSGGSNLPVRPKSKKAPPSAQTAIAKRVVSNARSAVFGTGGHFHDLWACPPRSLFRVDPNCRAARRLPPKTADLEEEKKEKEIARRNRTNDHTRRPHSAGKDFAVRAAVVRAHDTARACRLACVIGHGRRARHPDSGSRATSRSRAHQ